MIDSIDLRIGNCVFAGLDLPDEIVVCQSFDVLTVIKISEKEIELSNGGFYKTKQLSGVVLTGEFIISKTGVKPDKHKQYHFNKYYLHHHHSGSWSVFNVHTPYPLTEINFVHEWQNWHYALNKEELKFNL